MGIIIRNGIPYGGGGGKGEIEILENQLVFGDEDKWVTGSPFYIKTDNTENPTEYLLGVPTSSGQKIVLTTNPLKNKENGENAELSLTDSANIQFAGQTKIKIDGQTTFNLSNSAKLNISENAEVELKGKIKISTKTETNDEDNEITTITFTDTSKEDENNEVSFTIDELKEIKSMIRCIIITDEEKADMDEGKLYFVFEED